MGLMSREKGRKGEREVIAILQPVVSELFASHGLPAPVLKRNSLQCDGGGSDIIATTQEGSPEVRLAWLGIEVKFHQQYAVSRWWEQTLRQCGQHQTPILFYRRNNEAWRVRLFATLAAGQQSITVAANVALEDFLRWFRARLTQELSKGDVR